MNKKKLIELRCKAWGITEDEYYCNQCSDFSLEDMARAYRRGKNKGRAELKEAIKHFNPCGEWNDDVHDCEFRHYAIGYGSKLTKAKEIIKKFSEFVNNEIEYDPEHPQEHTDLWNKLCEEAEQFLNSEVGK